MTVWKVNPTFLPITIDYIKQTNHLPHFLVSYFQFELTKIYRIITYIRAGLDETTFCETETGPRRGLIKILRLRRDWEFYKMIFRGQDEKFGPINAKNQEFLDEFLEILL